MLQNIRDNSQSFIAKVIVGLIIGVFALFGVESIVGGFINDTSVAEVNGEEISQQELDMAVQRLIASLGGSMGDLDQGLLEQIALNQLVEDRILLQAARDSSMEISSDSIDRQIINTEQFQVNGRFDNDLARRTMASQGFTPEAYRQALRDRMMMSQLANAYSSSSFVTPAELERVAGLAAQTRDFRYLSVRPGNRVDSNAITQSDIEEYYENNQSQFMNPERVVVAYLMLDRAELFDEVEVDEQRLRELYESERAEEVDATERRASHILLETGSERSEEEALEEAENLRQQLEEGADFAELAREHSDDTVSAESGGDIGYTDGNVFPPAMEDALETLEVGQVSEPVVSEFGVHLVKLTEYETAEFPSFEEMRERLEQDLKSGEVNSLYISRLEELSNLAFESNDLQEPADWLDLEIQQSEPFGRDGGSGIASNDQVVSAAFSDQVLLEGNNSEVIELDDNRAVVLRVAEHREAAVRPLEQVRGEIAVMLRSQREEERARAIGAEILSALNAGEPVDEIIAEEGLEWREETGAERQEPTINRDILRNVFAMEPPTEGEAARYEGFALGNGTYVVAELQQVIPGSLEDMDEAEIASLREGIMQERGRAAFDALLRELRNEAEIEGSAMLSMENQQGAQ